MQLLEATLAKSPRQVSTKHGQRTVVDVLLPDGSKATLWRPENDDVLMGLRRGDRCQVCRDSKGKVSLVESNGTQAGGLSMHTSSTHQPLTPEQKLEVSSYMTEIAAIQSHAWDLSKTSMKDKGCSESVIQAFASGIVIATLRRFGLDRRVEFKSGESAAANCPSPAKPGARLNDAQKPQSSVGRSPARPGVTQPSLGGMPKSLVQEPVPSGSPWDVAG